MHQTYLGVPLCGLWLATSAAAATVDAFSEASYQHSYILNSGTMPAGLVSSFGGALQRSQDASTQLDAPVTNVIDVPSVQIANPFTDPPIPYFDRRGISETTPNNTQAARAGYNVNIMTTSAQNSPQEFAVVARDVDNKGSASFSSTDGSVNGEGASDFFLSREFEYTNASENAISFNIFGEFSANVSAGFEGVNGFARSSLIYAFEIDPSAGVEITYLPIAPYLRTIDDSGAGATVSDFLDIGEGGFQFSAGASALGAGDAVMAGVDGGFRYFLNFDMAPGASFLLSDRFTQTNAVEYRVPEMPPVPLPAGLPLLLCALAGLVGVSRVRSSVARSI